MFTVINEKRLLKNLPNFFANPSTVLTEIAQNAQRAGATELRIVYKDGVLEASDNGHGINTITPLVVLADSDWDARCMLEQEPAGFGLFHLFCISLVVSFTSRFGTISLDCQSFLNDEGYRVRIEELVRKEETGEGFKFRAVLKEDVIDKIIGDAKKHLSFFPMAIYINGERLERTFVKDVCSDWAIKTAYQGNNVYIQPYDDRHYISFVTGAKEFAERLLTVWYGIKIGDHRYNSCVAIDVTQESPITPVLPYRKEIKLDEKLSAFYEFVRKTTVDYCRGFINGPLVPSKSKDHHTIKCEESRQKSLKINAMRTMESIATQEELDQLNKYYLLETQPHSDVICGSDGRKLVDKGDIMESEIVSLAIDHGDGSPIHAAAESLVLPQGTITELTLPGKHPAWLMVREKEVNISIKGELVCSGYFTWYKSAIISQKNIAVAALCDDYGSGRVYYSKSANNFVNDVSSSVFEMHVVTDDSESDSYDSQQNYYNNQIESDISHICNKFSTYALFEGIQNATGVRHEDIVSINVDRRKRRIIVLGKREKKVVIGI